MKVRLLLFASAREAVGASSVFLDLPSPRNGHLTPDGEAARRQDQAGRHSGADADHRIADAGACRDGGDTGDCRSDEEGGCFLDASSSPLRSPTLPPSSSFPVSFLLSVIAEQLPALLPLLPVCALAVDRVLAGQEERVSIAEDSELALLPPVSGG
ncbi:hypothetical protein TGRH88_000520 [Toxoplasma gondii]|uniref:Molybdopterin synthase sulfur carrier subunit n=1 Tax=Toxoplasma gondii TaxID=5811 RepID=A0A7J6KDP3_TOXGO|nr:hypothetical protein TGRH88_000520 [Toxoplasma gondii]